jgi:putative mRNA 3-end processing factor
MLDGGPVVEYLKRFHDETKSAILLTGFQVETSNGARLLKEKKVELDGKEYQVHCFVQKYDFSAHSGRSQLHKMIKTIKPKHLLLVHGDPDGLKDLESFCKEKEIAVTTTQNGSEYSF